MSRVVENKYDLIKRLAAFRQDGHPGYSEGRGDRIIAAGLAAFFARESWIPIESPGNAYVYYLDRWLVDAFDALRTDPYYESIRREWKAMMDGHCDEIPDLINLGVSHPVWAALIGGSCARFLAKITDEAWLEEHIEAYLFAQSHAVMQCFRLFVRKAWRGGLCAKLKESARSGHGGVFGTTKLLAFASAGRVMLTFGDGTNGPSVSFVGEDGEAAGARFGLQSCHGSMVDAITLVGDVTAHWSLDTFKEDNGVSFG